MVKTDVVLEANVTAIGRIVTRVGSSRVVGILGPFIAAVGGCLVVVIVALLNHGWLIRVLGDWLVNGWLRKRHLALRNGRRLVADVGVHWGRLLVRWRVRRSCTVRIGRWYRLYGVLVGDVG